MEADILSALATGPTIKPWRPPLVGGMFVRMKLGRRPYRDEKDLQDHLLDCA
ncbi:Uncharacterised protein [Pseudomonas fluorescens]|uniref:Caspase family p10 domain-containing protein n=1 Tax=Pseudomonas fluorescens TaxID=294 RepID=A0A379IFD6_PSEFL|nr:Uncharacterised protein [Pseudomonas fluorescens]